MGAGSDNEPLASPGNFFPGRKRRVAELFAELLGRSFLPFPHFAGVDHHIMRVALCLDLDLAKFDQSCFHVLMLCWLELQGKRREPRMVQNGVTSKLRKVRLTRSRSFETRSLPGSLAATRRGFAIYVARTPAAPFASRACDVWRLAIGSSPIFTLK